MQGDLGAGLASGLSETSTELGGALGIAVVGSLVTAIYRHQMAVVPAGVPAAAAETARDTLGGAAEMARSLPPQAGGALLEAARIAFTEAVVLTAGVSAALAVAAAIVIPKLLGDVGVTTESAEQPGR